MKHPLIVTVDADLSFLELMSVFLIDEGYETLVLSENIQAYEIIKGRMPALVILELLIHDPDGGLGVLNKLRLDPQTVHIPVIIASTATDLILRNEQHLRSKHCDVLMKPFDLEELLVMVGKYAPIL